MKLAEKIFHADGVSINYAEGPAQGPPLMLLHGAGSVWQDWEPVIHRFLNNSHIYAPDFRGCGKSGRVPLGYRFIDFATDIDKFLRAQMSEPVLVIGHSLGAMVAIKIAADSPQLVRAIILEEPPLYLSEYLEDWIMYPIFPLAYELAAAGLEADEIARRFLVHLHVDEAEARKLGRSIAHIDPDLLAQVIDKTIWEDFNTDALLDDISCPVLLIHGEPALGSVVKPKHLVRAIARIRAGTVTGMQGLGHGLHTGDPEAFNRIIAEFLDSFLHG
jgi:pimeloyl-ACP methyl ester carboxylesterase